VLGEHVDEAVGEVDDAFWAGLRHADVDHSAVDALDLTGDLERLAEEVDVAELDAGGFTESETGERAEGDERLEPFVRHGHELPDLLGCGDRHGHVRATATGEAYAVGRAEPITLSFTAARNTDLTLTYRVLIVPGSEAGSVHVLDVGLDVRAVDASPRASRISGANLVVDGALTRGIQL
jgi:hypothetical protein